MTFWILRTSIPAADSTDHPAGLSDYWKLVCAGLTLLMPLWYYAAVLSPLNANKKCLNNAYCFKTGSAALIFMDVFVYWFSFLRSFDLNSICLHVASSSFFYKQMQENSTHRINVIILRLNFGEQKYPPKGHGGYESINLLVNAVLTLKTLIFLQHKLLSGKIQNFTGTQ